MNCLILGAGLMQKPAILCGKELGYKVCVVDADDKAVAISYADEFKKIDLKDKDGILKYAESLAKKENGGLDAVFTAGTDFSASVSYVCEKLNLPSHRYESALNASIKTKMRDCFSKNKVPSPKCIAVSKDELSEELLSKVLEKIDFPFVVKPIDNMGARGCRMVRNEKEFNSAITNAVKSSRSGNAIVEEYMEGPEFSIDALIYDGTFTVTGFAERHIKYEPYFIEVGHTMPAKIDDKMKNELISVFALGAKALGLSCGAAKADIKYTKNGPEIGEIAGRLSGGYMSGWTYPYSCNLNLTKEALKISAGKKPDDLISQRKDIVFTPSDLCKNAKKPYELFEVPSLRTASERAWMSIPGTVDYIENITGYTDQAIFDTLPRSTVTIGSNVDFPRNNVEKCGNIIAVSHSRNISIAAAEDAVSNIFITLHPNNQVTDDFINRKNQKNEENFPPDAFCKLSDDEMAEINGVIPADEKVENYIPNVLKKSEYINIRDWSYNTISQVAQKFDVLRAKHKPLDAKKFWDAVTRGGLQAAVYICDSL